MLTEEQPRKPYLGYGGAHPFSFTATLPPGGALLLATDGLFKYADHEQIAPIALLPDPEEATALLADLARSRTGTLHDDIAILLYRASESKEPGRKPGWWGRIAP